jgi:preprotein translocase subunit SecG
MSILLGILTVILIFVSLFLILLVLAQPAKSDGGMGSALGGGMAESAFGGSHGTVTSKLTIKAAIVFFVLSFALYLGNVYQRSHANGAAGVLPNIAVPATYVVPVSAAKPIAPVTTEPAPAATGATTTAPSKP